MATILLVSKPVEPPWNDSSKNLVRDLVLGMTRHDSVAFRRQGGKAPSDALASSRCILPAPQRSRRASAIRCAS